MTRLLAKVQTSFIDALRQPEATVPDAISTKMGEPVKRRFDVYRNNVTAGMIGALKATFPAVEKLVGAAFFAAAARVYLANEPPRSPILFRYGETFGDFLDSFEPASNVPYLGDVARLEWTRLQSHHAADAPPLAIEALSHVLSTAADGQTDIGKVKIRLHPSLRLIASRWPVFSLWAASTGQGSSEDVDMKRREHVLVVRPALSVETRLVPESGFVFISALMNDATLEEAASGAAEAAPDFDLAEHLQGLFAIGAVSAINGNTL
jgi:hypothetical protein